MAEKPTDTELAQRVETLKAALRQKERELEIRKRISHLFLAVPDHEMYAEVLQVVLEVLRSRHGVFGYIDEAGNLVCPSLTGDVWEECRISGKDSVFPRDAWGGIWGKAPAEGKTLCSNESFRVPRGHVPITRALDVPIMHRGVVVGNLLVGNKTSDYDDKDRESLETIAGLIAPLLHARVQRELQEKKRKHAEASLRRRAHELGERVKELNCLYGISRLVDKPDISLGEILQGVADLLSSAWQYPEITCARIGLEGREFKTANFRDSPWKQACDIMVDGEKIGTLEVCYLEKRPEIGEGPFLAEERSLIAAVCERLGKIIARERAEEMLKESEEKYRSLFENSADAVFITDIKTGIILDANRQAERLTGRRRQEIIGMHQSRLHSAEDVEYYRDKFRKNMQSRRVFDLEAEVVKKDGTAVPVFICTGAINVQGKTVAQGIFRDISQEKMISDLKGELASRRVVDKAKIIIAQRLKISEKDAIRRLQRESRRQRMKLKEMAEAVVSSKFILD
jgi:PAS domain S-box-containing protein